MRKVKITWPELNKEAEFILEDEKNKDLCDEFWNNLPMSAVQEHAGVSGEMIFAWLHMLSFAKVPWSQLHNEAPVGRVSYSQGTGQKFIIKYGEISEDCLCPVLGLIPEKYHADLKEIGKLIWNNYYQDKTVYTIKLEKVD